MPKVVLAGSENDTRFAVIDFTNPGSPSVRLVNPGFNAGCRVAIGGHTAVIGSVLTGDVRMADVSDPSTTVLQGNINTMLAGIGALAIRGSKVAVGEWVNNFQARVKLIDFSNPNVPSILGTAQTPLTSETDGMNSLAAISSLAFLNDNVVFVSGPASGQVFKVDFTSPGSPVVTPFNPVLSGGVSLDLDSGASRLAAGDNNSTILKFFNASTLTLIAQANTMLGGVISVSLSDPLVLAASPNDFNAVRVDFSGMPPTVTSFNPPLVGGSTTAIENTTGACGDILGSNVALINLAPATPSVLGTANAVIASISTLAMSTFTPAMVTTTPGSILFGPVRVGTPGILPLLINNTGSLPLVITSLASSSARFTFTPATLGPIAPGGNATVHVTFLPNAETVFNGNLNFNTNDPAHPSVSVSLSGTGALPHVSVSPSNLSLGSVPVCLSGTGTFSIGNSGGVPLTVSSIVSSDPSFTVTPASGIVGPGASLPITVTFAPGSLGNITGTITINSDDPALPQKIVTVNGIGLPSPPPSISISPSMLNFGATPLQFFIGLRITIANTGPCQNLTVDLATSGAPFFITDSDPTTLPPTSLMIPPTLILPGQSKRFVVVFAPVTAGVTPGSLTINSDDPLHAVTSVALSGNGVVLAPVAMELVLDRSGSMSAAAPGGTKMDALKAAVNLFADLVIPDQGDEMGSVEFDDAFNVLTPLGPYDIAKSTAIKADAGTLTPRNFTSIGGGLQLGQSQIITSAIPRKVMLVFTDGLENTPPMIATIEPGIIASGTEVYAIGLGQPQNISTMALQALAASANGKFFLTDDTLILRKNFTQVLADAFRNNMAADPVFNLGSGRTVIVPVQITQCESRIGFILNWENPQSQVEMYIKAPDGTTYFPSAAASNRLVRYGQKSSYCFYQISFPPIDPGSGLVIGPSQIGTWTMHITGTNLVGATERCATCVIVESDIKMTTRVHAPDINSPLQVVAQLSHNGVLITDAKVALNVTMPLKSLSAVSTVKVVQKALQADRHPIAPAKKPLIAVAKKKFNLKFSQRHKGFMIQLPPPRIDGVYQFEFQGTGKGCGGTFERYDAYSVYIGGKPDRKRTSVTVFRSPVSNRAVITIILADAKGKLLGPGHSVLIQPDISKKAGTVFGLSDNGDGSYTFQVMWLQKRPVPKLKVRVGGFSLSVNLNARKRK